VIHPPLPHKEEKVEITDTQRRSFIALACKMAWADGVVVAEERDFVRNLVERFGGCAISESELDQWLESGAPEAALKDLPEGMDQLFIYEAMRLMEVDGEIADSELEQLNQLMGRLFDGHSPKTPIAKIKLGKRQRQ